MITIKTLCNKYKNLIDNESLVEKFFNKIESQKEQIADIEDYLSALTAVVLLCPKFRIKIKNRDRLYEIGKNLFLDSKSLFVALYMEVLFPIKFKKVLDDRKKFYTDYFTDIITERTSRVPFEAWEIATSIRILMPKVIKDLKYEEWFNSEEIFSSGISIDGKHFSIYSLSERIGLTNECRLSEIKVSLDSLEKILDEGEKFITQELIMKDSIEDIKQGLWLFFDIKRIVIALPKISV